MGYTTEEGMVRVDFFKPSGKWYMTEAVDMSTWYDVPNIHDAVGRALNASRPVAAGWWTQFTVVVAEPYHVYAHPVMIKAVD